MALNNTTAISLISFDAGALANANDGRINVSSGAGAGLLAGSWTPSADGPTAAKGVAAALSDASIQPGQGLSHVLAWVVPGGTQIYALLFMDSSIDPSKLSIGGNGGFVSGITPSNTLQVVANYVKQPDTAGHMQVAAGIVAGMIAARLA